MALGVASNVLQFLDIGFKLVKTFTEFHHSAESASASAWDSEIIVSDLEALCKGLETSRNQVDDAELIKVASACRKLAFEFIDLLKGLRDDGRQPRSNRGRWGRDATTSLRRALKNLWKAGTLQDYTQRLDQYRGQIMARILQLLRY